MRSTSTLCVIRRASSLIGGRSSKALGAPLSSISNRRGRSRAEDGAASAKQAAVSRLIQIWTNRGHLLAKLDPLGLMQRPRPRVLELEYFGLTQATSTPSSLRAAAPRRFRSA